MTPTRLRLSLVLAGIVLGALVLLCWTRDWVVVDLVDGTRLSVTGQDAAPVLSALGLASLALSGALTIASRALRVVFGVVAVLIGGAVVATAVMVLADPVAASGAAITAATGITGAHSVHELVTNADPGFWPWFTAAIGVLAAVHGLAVALSAGRWPGASTKYQSGAGHDHSQATAWDSLSEGDDPTSR